MITLFNNDKTNTLVLKEGDKSKSGAQSVSARRQSRKEFAEANKIEQKAADFDDKYRAYLKGHEGHASMLLGGATQAGLIFAATSARKDKDGNIISLSIRMSKPPTSKVDAKAAQIAELTKQIEEMRKLLPPAKVEAKQPELPTAPAAPKK